jgi:hypothetical protein
MTADILEPRIELLSEEYVLVQAWKKTASHIRYHNWYSDTLALDRAAVNLPHFLAELAEQLKASAQWSNDTLRIVPAPKSQQWRVTPDTNLWGPVDRGETAGKLRPLAHVSLNDQVAATAVMLCLANRVETLQGDPRDSIESAATRRHVVSYGNRLFCDVVGEELHHRWGSGKLYRAYYQDYRSFLLRPEVAAEAVSITDNARVVIVHSDLRNFYDRVRPGLLAQKIDALSRPGDDPNFFALARRLLDWAWNEKDFQEVTGYAAQVELSDFSRVALPQGLVAAGFLANVVLLDFDQGLREALYQEIEPGVRLEDACRYVDDLRIVLTIGHSKSLSDIEQIITNWLQTLLDRHAEGLKPSDDKTRAAAFKGDERPLVRQSRKMARIQSAMSGGFDAIGGEEILDAVQGLIRSQQRYSEQRSEDQGWPFSPIPDVRDETVARFAAARFRITYRSLRPLLADREDASSLHREDAGENREGRSRVARTQSELDDEAKAFALGLIENWVEDPSNVRLLRIGLDLWPAEDVIRGVLGLLRPFTEKGGRRKAPRRVAWYCLSEVFRAGATETGFVEDVESLPAGIDIAAYRGALREEAVRLASMPPSTLPWYLKQQVLLFLAANDPTHAPVIRTGHSPETKQYRELIRFLKGEGDGMSSAEFATLAILARRSFLGQQTAVQLAGRGIKSRRLDQIGERDPSFALEILAFRSELAEEVSPRLRDELCLDRSAEIDGWVSLSQFVLQGEPNGPLRNELGILYFASKFLVDWSANLDAESITPSDVRLRLRNPHDKFSAEDEVKIVPSRVTPARSMYCPPPWCPADERWRFQLGYLLRFILSVRPDFTKIVRPFHWKEGTATYRAPDSHWYQRLYGLYNGQSAFGDDWLPISDWIERLLSALLNWPGCRTSEMVEWVRNGLEATRAKIENRLCELSEKQGPSSSVLMLPLTAPWPYRSSVTRPLRGCVVQTVIPTPDDFDPADLTVSGPAIRKRHRNHLSAALAAIERMLDLRATHKGRVGRLDWLILPELSVHPHDVRTHLIPFARAHKTIILAGLTYETLLSGKPVINSALWVIPVWSATHGLQVITRRQGKQHLAPDEDRLNVAGAVVQGFRPCQWLVGYEWSSRSQDRPLWLTASVCYDATDLCLAADLRRHSDVFAIPALNKDVSTFDQMALALHYHMFQMVIVANNGLYGGSNAYIPHKEPYVRQVFHLHGQPQASVAFFEIDPIAAFIARQVDAKNSVPPANGAPTTRVNWKFPPAGL